MSGLATAARAPSFAPAERVGAQAVDAPLPLRLVTFTALLLFASAHWVGLLADPPVWRLLAVAALAAAGGAGLALSARLALARPAAGAVRVATVLGIAAASLVAAGLPLRMLLPGGFGELGDGLDRGFAAVPGIDWPYTGGDDWVRLTLLLAIPAVAALASALAFWPARRTRAALRSTALALLILLYGVAVTEREFGDELLRGAVLLALVGAWLWLPRLRGPDVVTAVSAVAAAGVLSIGVASGLDDRQGWVDYRSWNLFAGGGVKTFDWTHRYGPMTWPRDGTTLLNVRADRAHYWKSETLDSFDGFRWVRSGVGRTESAFSELPDRLNPDWDERLRFTVRSLESAVVVGAGTTYSVAGVGPTATDSTGTTVALEEPLGKGDSYRVRAYVPDPSAAQMRRASTSYEDQLHRYTSIGLPLTVGSAVPGDPPPGDASRSAAAAPPVAVVPLRGEPADADARAALEGSPYRRVYGLARRLAAGAPTAYDAVKRIENHLQREYTYNEQPPRASVPLDAFLFEDRIGYCQHFAGAMALMLRMNGIPARVAAGFAPGSYNRDTKEFRVRDLDAHSWVEVHFPGLGWVPFDPTPPVAPAESQSTGAAATSAARGDAGDGGGSRPDGGDPALSENSGGNATPAARDEGGLGAGWLLLAGAGLLSALALVARRRRRPARADDADRDLAQLERLLDRAGYPVGRGSTLLSLERSLTNTLGPRAGRYAGRLRERRFAGPGSTGPDARDRRELRRALAARAGIRGRLRLLLPL